VKSDDDLLAIAARIADGSGVDWAGIDETASEVEDLKAIAHIAALHRAPTAPPESALLGRRWGSLSIVEEVGKGRFGRVYRAWDARLERFVALKILDAPAAPNVASPLRAIDEGRLLARVLHPNVLTVHGAECLEGQVGIWTEYVEGRTLEDLLTTRGPFAPEEVISIGVDLCRALTAVHQAGLLHRDVKAQNVMRETGGRIVLMDFGTGHDLDWRPTRAGDLSGTPLYLAPEIFSGAPATPASEVYALAVLLFRLLSGTYPVPGTTLGEVKRAHEKGRLPDLRSAAPQAPPKLVAAIERGLAVDPAARFSDLTSFETAIAAARPSSTTSGTSGQLRRPLRRSLLIAAAVVLAIGLTTWTLDVGGLRHRWLDRWTAGLVSKPLPARIRMPVTILGQPSRDGRFYPYVDRHGDVQVWEVVTGISRRITSASAGESGASAVMSADGSRVAYEWLLPDHAYELRTINADGTWPAVLVSRETAFEPVPVDWSRDGRNLLCWFQQRNGSWDLALVPTAGGSPKVIGTFAKPQPLPASLSPDGRYVVRFTRQTGGAAPARQLELRRTDQAASSVTLDAQLSDAVPMWSPAGDEVLFFRRSKVAGPADAWVVPVSRGAWAGSPSLAFKDALPGTLSVVYFNVLDDGRIQEQVFTATSDVYMASIAPSGTVGAPTRVSPTHIGEHGSPQWSPDGQSIAYLRRPSGTQTRILTIQDLQAGTERELTTSLDQIQGFSPTWLENGREVIVDGQDQPDLSRLGFYRVDVRTGQTSPVVITGTDGNLGSFVCTRDGRTLLYQSLTRGLVAHDLSSGRETVVLPPPVGRSQLSPDGRSIAFEVVTHHGDNADDTNVIKLRAPDGQTRVVVDPQGHGVVHLQSWASNALGILYTAAPNWQNDAVGHLWRIDPEGQTKEDMGLAVVGNTTNRMSVTRDGRRLLYTEALSFQELRTTPGPVITWTRPGR
jgi:Tol biopolymer transport system component